MLELIRTNDVVTLGFAESLLRMAGVPCFVADAHMSAIEGGLGAFPRRLMVDADSVRQARRILIDAGLGPELRPD